MKQRSECMGTPPAINRDTVNSERGAEPLLKVYFDGACPLCTLEIDHYSNQPGSNRLTFVDVSAPDPALGPDLSPDAAIRRFHVRLADGRLVVGARAFVVIWQQLPRWRWAARLALLPGVSPVLELAYRTFLPVRPFIAPLARWLGARPARERNGRTS